MRSYFLIVSVGVEYPALLSTVDCVGVVGFILRLKAQVFSLILYKQAIEFFWEKMEKRGVDVIGEPSITARD